MSNDTTVQKMYLDSAAQEKRREKSKRFAVLSSSLVTEIPLWFQPLGIAVRQISPNTQEVAIADYFFPAVHIWTVTRDKGDVILEEKEMISVVQFMDKTVRLFPDIAQPGGANRVQCVLFAPDGNIWVSRSTGKSFFVLGPPQGSRWMLNGQIHLPVEHADAMVISAFLSKQGNLFTLEERISPEERGKNTIALVQYHGSMERVLEPERILPKFLYGIGERPDQEGVLWFVTEVDFPGEQGMYRLNLAEGKLELVVSTIQGNGLVFLADGSALVTRFGYNARKPGALTYIPARSFSEA